MYERLYSTYPQLSQYTNGVASAVLYERTRNDLHRVRDRTVRPALDASHATRLRVQTDADSHLRRAAARCKRGVKEDVARDRHRVREVAVDLVQDVLGRAAEEDRARLRLLALGEEREVLVPDLLDVEEAALGADVRLAQVLDAVHDRRADCARDTVVVRLAHAPDRGHVCLVQEVLRVVCRIL